MSEANCPKAPLGFCPFSVALFLVSAGLHTYFSLRQRSTKEKSLDDDDTSAAAGSTAKEGGGSSKLPPCQVVFVLGGPGAGKGTQCAMIEKNFPDWKHLSAGDLLRSARKSGGPVGDLVNKKIAAGQLVPADITVGLLKASMQHAYAKKGTRHFLIDGFPRNQDNVSVWEMAMPSHKVEFVLYFDCPEEVLVGRLLERGQTSGRNDDKLDVIRKRFRTFQEESYPIVQMYEQTGQVKTIASDQSVEQVYSQVAALFQSLKTGEAAQ